MRSVRSFLMPLTQPLVQARASIFPLLTDTTAGLACSVRALRTGAFALSFRKEGEAQLRSRHGPSLSEQERQPVAMRPCQ